MSYQCDSDSTESLKRKRKKRKQFPLFLRCLPKLQKEVTVTHSGFFFFAKLKFIIKSCTICWSLFSVTSEWEVIFPYYREGDVQSDWTNKRKWNLVSHLLVYHFHALLSQKKKKNYCQFKSLATVAILLFYWTILLDYIKTF